MAVDQKKPKSGASASVTASTGKRTHIGSKELKPNVPTSSTLGNAIPEKWRDPLAIILIFVSLLLFFNKVLDQEHVLNAGDNIASESFKPFLEQSEVAGQKVPQWMPLIFGGMPAFAGLVVTGERTYDLVHEIFYLVRAVPRALFPNPDMMTQIFHYFLLGLGMYLLLRVTRNTSRLVALFAAFSAIFSTWILTYVMIGHNTKIFAVMTLPYILMAIEKLRQPDVQWTRMVFWSAILAVFFHFALESTHMQMVFYICLAVLIYFLYNGISELIRKVNVMPTIRTGVITIAMVGLAFAMSADRYMATLGYEPYSIRGKQPVTALRGVEAEGAAGQQQKPSTTAEGGGLNWDYATQYSFSPQEMITFLVPGWFGFGKLPYEGSDLNLPEGTRVPTYWGQMLMTDAANYTGVIVFFFAMIGIFAFWKRDRLIPPLAIISLIALLLSFGGNFPVLFRPMFDYFPTFNKFRAPMMALVLMQLAFPIIAAITLQKLLVIWKHDDHEEKERVGKWFKYGMYLAGALLVVFTVGRGAFSSSITEAIAKSGKPLATYPESLKSLAVSTAMNDAMIGMIFAAIACALALYMLKGKISPLVMGVVILALSLMDQWRVGSRPMEVTTRAEYSGVFNSHDYVEFIKQDKGVYRILDLNEPTSNVTASWGLQSIAGYHAAKMRSYQDVVDVTGKANGNVIYNPFMWNLLNAKYIIADGAISEDQTRFNPVFQSQEPAKQSQDGKPGQSTIVWENPQALPRAFFVRTSKVQDSLQTLYAMRDATFDPREVVFLTKDAADLASASQNPIDSTEHVDVVKYGNEDVEYKTTASAERILFISDTWYPDWTATIDGKVTPIHKANYAFRAIKVPAGQHTVKFSYEDPRYATGKTLSLASNVLVLIGLAIGLAGATVFPKKHKLPKAEVLPPEDKV
jgi:hypothetical protein